MKLLEFSFAEAAADTFNESQFSDDKEEEEDILDLPSAPRSVIGAISERYLE